MKVISKFHDDPTVEESRIVVLLRLFLGLYGIRESYDAKDISLTSNIAVSKFYDDPTVNESGIVI